MNATQARKCSLDIMRKQNWSQISKIQDLVIETACRGEFNIKVCPDQVSPACEKYLTYSGYKVTYTPKLTTISWEPRKPKNG